MFWHTIPRVLPRSALLRVSAGSRQRRDRDELPVAVLIGREINRYAVHAARLKQLRPSGATRYTLLPSLNRT